MINIKKITHTLAMFALLSSNAYAGDNSQVPLAIGVAVGVVVLLGVVLFFTKDKK